jgi:hypothetical protein
VLEIAGRPDIAYDTVSFDIGITSDMPALAGFAEPCLAGKADWTDGCGLGAISSPAQCRLRHGPASRWSAAGLPASNWRWRWAHRLRSAGTIPQSPFWRRGRPPLSDAPAVGHPVGSCLRCLTPPA